MSLFKRGSKWWYEFEFRGQRIRESSYSSNKDLAGRVERERRRALELGSAGLKEQRSPQMFSIASKGYLETNKAHWSPKTYEMESLNINRLLPHFGRILLMDIDADSIARYQSSRHKTVGPRTINLEVCTVRAILRKHRLWANIQPDVKMLRTRSDIGRALSADEVHRLLVACKKSRSRSLYPAVLLSLHTGLRNAELRLLRWRQVDLLENEITVGKSKTVAGEGRVVPLSNTAIEAIQEWRRQFPNAQPAHFVFPTERYGLDGEEGYLEGKRAASETDPTKHIGSWKTAWTNARKDAKVQCRWHDMRHTFVSRMAESQASDATIMSLAGHVSRKMMERYSHTRGEAKKAAIAVLDEPPSRLA
jgi:integrase